MNIAKILQQKPIKCNLWSPLIGECYFDRILPNNRINVRFLDCDGHYKEISFSEDGRYFDTGECMLFPSEKMRDWNKYAWKEGDSLASNYNAVTFSNFYNEQYTCFLDKKGRVHKTNEFYKPQIFRPYDRVLVRNDKEDSWIADLFSNYRPIDISDYVYCCIGGNYKQCIPFKEEYVGTTKNPK